MVTFDWHDKKLISKRNIIRINKPTEISNNVFQFLKFKYQFRVILCTILILFVYQRLF